MLRNNIVAFLVYMYIHTFSGSLVCLVGEKIYNAYHCCALNFAMVGDFQCERENLFLPISERLRLTLHADETNAKSSSTSDNSSLQNIYRPRSCWRERSKLLKALVVTSKITKYRGLIGTGDLLFGSWSMMSKPLRADN